MRFRLEGVLNEWRLSTAGGAAYMQHVLSHLRFSKLKYSRTLRGTGNFKKRPLRQRSERPPTRRNDSDKIRKDSASPSRAALTALLMFFSLELCARTSRWPVGGSRIALCKAGWQTFSLSPTWCHIGLADGRHYRCLVNSRR